MLRYLFLRFLPRRLVPLLFLLELYRLFRGWQTRNDPVVRRTPMARTGTAVDGTPGYRTDRSV
jgi:hypothetical protein